MIRLIFGDIILVWYFLFMITILFEHTPVRKEGDLFLIISSLILGFMFLLEFIDFTHLAGILK